MVKIRGIEKKFGKLKVLRELDLILKGPGIVALLGPNGSGKTTLIKCILGMVIPDNGKIEVNETDISGKWEYRRHIDYLPQIARFPDNVTVREVFHMISDLRGGDKRKDELIRLFGLNDYLDKKLGTLSGGTRQKVNLVLAFMFDNNIIILDEPSAGLDPVSMVKLKDLIKAERDRGKLIVMTTHIMGMVEELADQIIFILEGKIFFEGRVSEIMNRTGKSNLEDSIAELLERDYVENS